MGKQADAPKYVPPSQRTSGPAPASGGGLGGTNSDAYNTWQAGQPTSWQQGAEAQSGQSHVGLNGAFGSSGWQQDPKTGQWTQSQQFAPGLQGAVSGLEGQIANQGPLGSGQDAANAAYTQATSRLDPQWSQQGQALQSRLAAQGLDPGTEAANNAQGNFDRAKNDAYSSAQNNAFGQGMAMRGQNMQAQMMPYQQLQGLQGLLGNAQGVGGAQAPNYLAALSGQAGQNASNAEMGNQLWGSGLQAAGQAGAAAFMLSDERAKFRIEKLGGDVVPGIPWVSFEYRDNPGIRCIGVLAQDVQRVRPDLVRERADGLFEVNYGGLR